MTDSPRALYRAAERVAVLRRELSTADPSRREELQRALRDAEFTAAEIARSLGKCAA
jgi:hypothetical protein